MLCSVLKDLLHIVCLDRHNLVHASRATKFFHAWAACSNDWLDISKHSPATGCKFFDAVFTALTAQSIARRMVHCDQYRAVIRLVLDLFGLRLREFELITGAPWPAHRRSVSPSGCPAI